MLFERSVRSVAGTWFAGLLVLLPLALTLAVLAWVLNLLYRYFGPASLVGRLFATLGYPFASNPGIAYAFGTLVLMTLIYFLGVIVRMGFTGPMKRWLDQGVRRIPIVGGLYGVADRFVALLDQKQGADIGAMRPVWCFFGGDGAAVLALAPSAKPVTIEERDYFAVLVPTAPVPFGGALIYVPAAWVKPAKIGVDKLTAIYVSMGITPPDEAGRGATPKQSTKEMGDA